MPILVPGASNPLRDGRQSPTALEIRRGVSRLLREHGSALVAEFQLANGRRADLAAIDRSGKFVIIEIKSSVADFRADGKWPDYTGYCDRFYFATHAGVPPEIFPHDEGLILADRFGAEILRDSRTLKLAPARRKAVTLSFAHAAANRLERVLDHCEAMGIGDLPVDGQEPL